MRHPAIVLSKRRRPTAAKSPRAVLELNARRDQQPSWLQFKDPADRLIAAAGSAEGAALSWHSRDGLGSPAVPAHAARHRVKPGIAKPSRVLR
jgi:hypothetical protein